MTRSHRAFVLANNRGGSGKTFSLFQLASQIAAEDPTKRVLVIDFSLYSETSSLFMGGMARKSVMSAERGHENTVQHTTSDQRAEGLIRDLSAGTNVEGQPQRSLFGRIFSTQPVQQEIDLLKYTVRPARYNPRIPENVYLVCSAKTLSWGEQLTGASATDGEAPMWARRGNEWVPVAQRLRQALSALSSEWVVFIDTDHLAASPLTKVALGAADQTLIPLSLDEGDFSRMFEDATGNALFTDVMSPMAADRLLSAPVSKFIFTKVVSQKNEPVMSPGGTPLPFSPAKAAQEQMDNICGRIFDAARDFPDFRQCLKDGAPQERVSEFAGEFFTAIKTVADVAANTSKLHGAPIATMRSDDAALGKPDKKVIDAVRAELRDLVGTLLDGN
jgi:cellulose biosynthesis protein BcsQ